MFHSPLRPSSLRLPFRAPLALIVVAATSVGGVMLATSASADAAHIETVTVSFDPGTSGFIGTGFVLKPDAPPVVVTASGTTNCGNPACNALDANGRPADSGPGPMTGFLAQGLNRWALVGQVDSGTPFNVGTGPTIVSGSGELMLAYNDQIGFSFDNSGRLTVTITYECVPGNGFGDKNHYHCGPPGQQ